jgi:peroxiredoxin Q/BCP
VTNPLQPGDPAPPIELDGTNGPFSLAEQRGQRVVLFFYPGDNNLICTRQLCSYRDRVDQFNDLGVYAVGISPQSIASHQNFINEHQLTLPLLTDTNFEVSKAYNVHSPRVGTNRATFIIDEAGIIRYRHKNLLSLSYDTVDRITHALARLAPAAWPTAPNARRD